MLKNLFIFMAQNKNLEQENNLYLFSVPQSSFAGNASEINMLHINFNTTQHIALVLKLINIKIHSLTDKKIYLTATEYNRLKKIFKKLKEKLYLTLPKGKKNNENHFNHLFNLPINTLTGWYSRYNDPVESDWEFLKKHFVLKTENAEKTPSISEKAYQRTNNFINIIQNKIKHSAIAKRIINEFVQEHKQYYIYTSIAQILTKQIYQHSVVQTPQDLFGELPSKLIIDISPQTQEYLKSKKFTGCFNKKDYLIQLQRNLNVMDMVGILLHELRHTIQHRYKFDILSKNDNITSSCHDFVRNLAIEAEAKAYENIYNLTNNQIENYIYHMHERQVLDELSEHALPIRRNIPPEDRLLAIFRYIEACTTEKTIQTLCDVYLAKSRVYAMQALNKNKISLPPQWFHTLMKDIEEWKKTYFKHYHGTLILDKKFSKFNDENESQIVENRFTSLARLRVDLRGYRIFSKQTARNIGIYQSIYGHTSKTPKDEIIYQYQGISSQIMLQADKLFKEGNTKDMLELYKSVQEKNLFLPQIQKHLFGKDVSITYIAHKCYRVLQKMEMHEAPAEILSLFQYDMSDYFNGKTLSAQKPTLLTSQSKIQTEQLRLFVPRER